MTKVLVLVLVMGALSAASGQTYYSPDILTLIENHNCASCHGGSGGLFVIPYDSIMSSGNHGPVVTPFDTNSIIVQKLKGIASFGVRMPFGGPYLSENEIATVVKWIAGGALEARPSSVAGEDPGVPLRTGLLRNYPNPFNPTTTIQFSIKNTEFIILNCYDLLGREVAVLTEGVKQPGTYAIEFNGARLSSGIYLYRLDAGGIHETRKMALLR